MYFYFLKSDVKEPWQHIQHFPMEEGDTVRNTNENSQEQGGGAKSLTLLELTDKF